MADKVIARLRAELSASTAGFQRNMRGAQRTLQATWKGFQRFGSSLRSMGRTMAVSLTLPIALFAGATLTAAGNFEAAMNRVEAKAGATSAELVQMREQAKDLGRATQFAASEAAAGFETLSQAGFKAKQSMVALPKVLNFAAGGELELAEAAGIAADTLGQFGLAVDQTGRVSDVFVKAANMANQTTRDLAESMKFAGPVAKEFGVGLEESTALITGMAKAGIRGSMAGTALRKMLTSLASPSAQAQKIFKKLNVRLEDSPGKLRNLTDILGDMSAAGANAAQVMTIFGDRAGPGAAKLLAMGAPAIRQLKKALEDSAGYAAEQAAAKMKGFNGEMKKLASAFEGLQLAIADSGLLASATHLVSELARITSNLAKTNPEILKMGTGIAMAAAVAGPLAIGVGILIEQVGGLGSALVRLGIRMAASALAAGGSLMALVTGPIGLSVIAIAAGAYVWTQYGEAIRATITQVAQSVRAWLQREMPETFAMASKVLEDGGKAWASYTARLSGILESAREAVAAWTGTWPTELGSISGHVDAWARSLAESLPGAVDLAVTAAASRLQALMGELDFAAVADRAREAFDAVADVVGFTVTRAGTSFNRLRTILGTAITQFVEFGDRVSGEIDELFDGLPLQEKLKVIADTVFGTFEDLTQHILTAADFIATTVEDLVKAFGSAVTHLSDFGHSAAKVFDAVYDAIAGAASQLDEGFAGFEQWSTDVDAKIMTVRQSVITGMGEMVSGARTKLSELGTAWADWSSEVIRTVHSMGVKIAKKMAVLVGVMTNPTKAAMDAVLGLFRAGEHEAVGGSIIPDMVEAIGGWMEKLKGLMSGPTRQAVELVLGLLEKLDSAAGGKLSDLYAKVQANMKSLRAAMSAPAAAAATATGGAGATFIEPSAAGSGPNKPLVDPRRISATTAALKVAMRAVGTTLQSSLEGAIENFVETGKLSFKDLRASLSSSLRELSGGFLKSALGGFGARGKRSGMLGGISNLLGFARGGSFTVGGSGGTDSKLVQFMATPGERVNVATPGQATGDGGVQVHLNLSPGLPGTVRAEVLALLPQITRATAAGVAEARSRGRGI